MKLDTQNTCLDNFTSLEMTEYQQCRWEIMKNGLFNHVMQLTRKLMIETYLCKNTAGAPRSETATQCAQRRGCVLHPPALR